MSTFDFSSKEKAFDFLENYAGQRREEIDRRNLGQDQGLIKSYLIETLPCNGNVAMDVPAVLTGTNWRVTPIEQDALYRVQDNEGGFGFLEPLSSRHLVLHSTKETNRADKVVRNAVLSTSQLDFTWLAGSTFQTIWQNLIMPLMPDRLVTFKFEYLARFEETTWDGEDEEQNVDEDWSTDELIERRASKSAITERSSQLAQFLPQLQDYHLPFRAIKMLRIPAADVHGGYDFWSWGKVTYRAPSFRVGRSQIRSIVRLYEKSTRQIEKKIWLQTEKTTLHNNNETMTLTGAPVTFIFKPPLSLQTFQNLIVTTFERGQGPFRLWGNPIYLGEDKVHIYGIDLHLWKRIYLEITRDQMIVVLPSGTCGNSVHRLVANIQRYLTPGVEVFVGDERYNTLIENAFIRRTG
ncbi:MAG: hypothetical protein JXA42_10140 [Anaerolineales bacterium]|nr:hypothetical protein [Anaerolineales bacterium]